MNFGRLRILLIASFMLISLVPLASLGYKAIFQGETLIGAKALKDRISITGINKKEQGYMKPPITEGNACYRHTGKWTGLSGM